MHDRRKWRERFLAALQEQHRVYFDPAMQEMRPEYAEYTACPLCGSTESTLRFEKDWFKYNECADCALVYMNPRLNHRATQQFYNSNVNEIYNETKFHDTTLTKGDDDRNLANLDLLAKHGARSGKLLEIGCAKGFFLVKAKERGGGRAAPGAKQQIVERVNDKFNLSPTSALTISGISQHVAIRGAGVSPELPGPKSTVPKELTKALGIRAQLMQLCGQEQGSRKLLASAMASVKGTDLEALLDSRGKRLRMVRAIKAACPELRTLQRKNADDRRAEWLCRSRLLRWFLGYVRLAAH